MLLPKAPPLSPLLETFKYIYMYCPLYLREGVAKHWVKADSVSTFLKFFNGNPAAFAFPDFIALSLSKSSS